MDGDPHDHDLVPSGAAGLADLTRIRLARSQKKSFFRHFEPVDGQFALFGVGLELKPVSQQMLQEHLLFFSLDRVAGFGLDIVAVRIEPLRSADNLIVLQTIRRPDQHPERYIVGPEKTAVFEIDDTTFPAGGIRVNGSGLEGLCVKSAGQYQERENPHA